MNAEMYHEMLHKEWRFIYALYSYEAHKVNLFAMPLLDQFAWAMEEKNASLFRRLSRIESIMHCPKL